MIIRSSQFAVFQQQVDMLFVERVVRELLETDADVVVQFPTYTTTVSKIPDETLQFMVTSGIARARNYSMTWESALFSFVSLMFSVAPNFDQHPNIQQVLKDTTIVPDERIDQLWERISEEDWEAVEQNYNPHAWGIEPVKKIKIT